VTVPDRAGFDSPRGETTAVSPRLRFHHAALRRGARWLFRDLTLDLPAGKLIAVTGPSGTGKSSLLTCIGSGLALDEGRIENITPRSSRGNEAPSLKKNEPPHVGCYESRVAPAWVFQDLRLVAQASLLANVLMARLGRYAWWETLWSFPAAERRAALAQLHELEIGPLALRPARETSGGEQQRAAVARALFAQAPLLLADEPVANLNEELAGCVLQRLRREAHERGALVICVLHHEEQVREFADAALRLHPDIANGWQWEVLR
jgi:phosphonate transport system ATP-binding protein